MNVYDQIQNLDPGTEATVTLRGTVRDGGGFHVLEFGDSLRLTTSLIHAESVTVHEPAIKWQEGDVVLGAPGETYVRNEDGEWRFSSGYPSFIITDKTAHVYAPVIREGKIVAQPEPDPDRPKVGDVVTEDQIADLPTGSRITDRGGRFWWERRSDGSWFVPAGGSILRQRSRGPRTLLRYGTEES